MKFKVKKRGGMPRNVRQLVDRRAAEFLGVAKAFADALEAGELAGEPYEKAVARFFGPHFGEIRKTGEWIEVGLFGRMEVAHLSRRWRMELLSLSMEVGRPPIKPVDGGAP